MANKKTKKIRKIFKGFYLILVIVLVVAVGLIYVNSSDKNYGKESDEDLVECTVIVPEGCKVYVDGAEQTLQDYTFSFMDYLINNDFSTPGFKKAEIKGIYSLNQVTVSDGVKDYSLINLKDSTCFADRGVYGIDITTLKERAAQFADRYSRYIGNEISVYDCSSLLMSGSPVEGKLSLLNVELYCDHSGSELQNIKVSEPLYLAERWAYININYDYVVHYTDGKGDVTDPTELAIVFYLEDDGYWYVADFLTSQPYTLASEDWQSWIAPDSMPYGKYPYKISVNRVANCVTVYRCDENGEYTIPVKSMVCSTGREGCETPLGTFNLEWRSYWGERGWCYMADGSYGSYAMHFLEGGYMIHTICYETSSTDSMFAFEYNMLGDFASLGCVRLQTIDARWIYDNVADGSIVEVYDDADNPGPLGKPSRFAEYISDEDDCGWDPTDPLPSNPWRQK